MLHKRRSPPDVEPSSSEGNNSDVEGSNQPEQVSEQSGTPEKRSAGPSAPPVVANVRFDAIGGAYVGMQTSARGGSATTLMKAPPRAKGPRQQTPKCPFCHQKCRLCSHPRIFETCSGLNVHSTLQHGKYYSAKWDNFVPIPECDLCAAQDKERRGQQHRVVQTTDTPTHPEAGWGRPRVDTSTAH